MIIGRSEFEGSNWLGAKNSGAQIPGAQISPAPVPALWIPTPEKQAFWKEIFKNGHVLHPSAFFSINKVIQRTTGGMQGKNPSCTMVENRKRHRQNSHPIIQCPTSEGVSEVSKRANEWAQLRVRAKWAVRCKRTSERMSERTSEWPSTTVCILGCYRP